MLIVTQGEVYLHHMIFSLTVPHLEIAAYELSQGKHLSLVFCDLHRLAAHFHGMFMMALTCKALDSLGLASFRDYLCPCMIPQQLCSPGVHKLTGPWLMQEKPRAGYFW